MAVTFDEARAIVDRELRPTWPARLGTFMVADWGREDDDHYFVTAGAQECLVDGDSDYMLMGPGRSLSGMPPRPRSGYAHAPEAWCGPASMTETPAS